MHWSDLLLVLRENRASDLVVIVGVESWTPEIELVSLRRFVNTNDDSFALQVMLFLRKALRPPGKDALD